MKKESRRKRKTKEGMPAKSGPALETVSVLSSEPGKIMLWVSLVLVALILVIYAPAWHYGFLTWDDPWYVSRNAEVLRGLTRQGLQWAFTTGHASNWHPLTWLSHMLDVQLYGGSAGFHHLTNILLHIANSILLFWVLRRMTGAWRPAAFVAALFAVHPTHVESVAWIAERKDVLSAFFCLLTLHAYISYARKPQPSRYLPVAVLFALGLMSKPMLVTVPVILLLLDLWPLRRARLQTGQMAKWRRLVLEKLPLLALSAASSIMTVLVQWKGGAMTSLEATPFPMRIANAVVSYAAYVGKMLWPANMVAFYPYNPWPLWLVGLCLLMLAAITFAALRLARKAPFVLVGWLWYLVALLPVIGLIQVGDQAMADRYTYLPYIGLFILVAWSFPPLLERLRQRRIVLSAAGLFVVCALTAVARGQVRYWESDLALWTHAVENGGSNNFVAHTKLGAALSERGDLASAIDQYTKALQINPDMDEAHLRLGLAYYRQGRIADALAHYNETLRINPNVEQAYINRGVLFATQGKRDLAIPEFQKAIKINPKEVEAHYNLGHALADEGRTDEAIAQFREVVRLAPEHAQAYNKMGSALALQGNLDEAIAQFNRAVSIKANFVEARVNLGVALMSLNRDNEALAQFMEALRINPNLAQVHNNVGVLLANQGKTGEAIAHFNEALRLYPGSVDVRENLRNALARQGGKPASGK